MDEIDYQEIIPFENGEYITTGVIYKVIYFDPTTYDLTISVEDIISFKGIGVLPCDFNSLNYN